jgi:fructose/tagatose bisphosphate aldolase
LACAWRRQALDHAAERGCGVTAFNVNALEQIQARQALPLSGTRSCCAR